MLQRLVLHTGGKHRTSAVFLLPWQLMPKPCVQAAIEKERVLGKIMDRRALSGTEEEEQFAQIAKQRDIPEWSVPHYLTDLYQLSLSSDPNTIVLSSFTDRITDLVAQVRPGAAAPVAISDCPRSAHLHVHALTGHAVLMCD